MEASRNIIGKYKRNENSPSIEMAVKIADSFDVTIDYLIDNGKYAAYDKDVIERIEDIQALDANTRTTLFNVIEPICEITKCVKHKTIIYIPIPNYLIYCLLYTL